MTRGPSRLVRALSSALAAGSLLITTACSGDGGEDGSRVSGLTASQAAGKRQTPSPSPTAPLTENGARTALITEADIEDDWTQVKDTEAEKWHDGLLIGTVDVSDFLTARADAADCQRLMNSLFDDDLLGKPSGANALRGFEQGDSRLLHQVASYGRTGPQESLDWMATLPEKCDQFTMTEDGEQRTVQVIETSLPRAGDTREGLRVTVQGTTGGMAATLTLDVAAVRVGDDAITVTAGGLHGDEHDSLEQAVRIGTQRLNDVLAGKTPSPAPSEVQ
ncbi:MULTISPECIES: hypothetical protein [unclassified Streptomyces]|uniref:hypothetical protein n=1 Tax=unclassified Streptomyces TaxID=2593676 RepID=UPI0004BFC4F5|nr:MULTISPECIES: hypothetical protein [unclassified Streptomyces]